MIRIQNDNTDRLLSTINIELNFKCAICGHQLLSRVVANGEEVQILPCSKCMLNPRKSEITERVNYLATKHEELRNSDEQNKQDELNRIEAKIYKEYEKRWRSLMKPIKKKTEKPDPNGGCI